MNTEGSLGKMGMLVFVDTSSQQKADLVRSHISLSIFGQLKHQVSSTTPIIAVTKLLN
jgi:hypothetical protein